MIPEKQKLIIFGPRATKTIIFGPRATQANHFQVLEGKQFFPSSPNLVSGEVYSHPSRIEEKNIFSSKLGGSLQAPQDPKYQTEALKTFLNPAKA